MGFLSVVCLEIKYALFTQFHLWVPCFYGDIQLIKSCLFLGPDINVIKKTTLIIYFMVYMMS